MQKLPRREFVRKRVDADAPGLVFFFSFFSFFAPNLYIPSEVHKTRALLHSQCAKHQSVRNADRSNVARIVSSRSTSHCQRASARGAITPGEKNSLSDEKLSSSGRTFYHGTISAIGYYLTNRLSGRCSARDATRERCPEFFLSIINAS